MDQYLQRCPKFQKLAAATQTAYHRELTLAARVLGSLDVAVIQPVHIYEFLDSLSELPGKARMALAALQAVEKWALRKPMPDNSRLLPHAITTGARDGIAKPDPENGHHPWTYEQVIHAVKHTRADIAKIILMGAHTGQRGSDLVAMRWSKVRREQGLLGIYVKQIKTGVEIWRPFVSEMAGHVERWERERLAAQVIGVDDHILTRLDGRPWTRKDLSLAWLAERRSNPALKGYLKPSMVLHGLRAYACVDMKRRGCTTLMISDTVGLTEDMVINYCRLSDKTDNAIAAVLQMDPTLRAQHRPKRSEVS